MPRRSKGPHLYFRERKGRAGVWVIRDGEAEISTGESYGNRGEAEKALAKYIGDKHTPDFGNGDPARVSIADCLALYNEGRAVNLIGDGPKTAGYATAALLRFWGDKTCSAVSKAACGDYADHRRATGIKDGTIRRELTVLSAALNYAVGERKLTTAATVTMPDPPAGRERWLTRDEAARLLGAALGFYVVACDRFTRQPVAIRRRLQWRSIQTARFILLALYTGTRHSAAASLRWGVNSSAGWIDLDRGVLYRRAEGERQSNKKKPPARLNARLLGHMRRARKRTINGPVEYAGEVVAEIDTGFNRARLIAGLGEDVTPHTLRHTAATWGMQNRADPWELSGYLGMSMKTLTERYSHHHPDYQLGAANAISGAVSGAKGERGKVATNANA